MFRYLPAYLLLILVACRAGDKNTPVLPERRDITESVYASVTVRPEVVYTAQSMRAGIIEALHVAEGDAVRAGQLLFNVRPGTEQTDRLTSAQLTFDEALSDLNGPDNRLRNISLEMGAARKQRSLDSLNYQRRLRLWNQGIGTRIELDRAELDYTTARSRYDALEKTYEQARRSLQTGVRKARSGSRTVSVPGHPLVVRTHPTRGPGWVSGAYNTCVQA